MWKASAGCISIISAKWTRWFYVGSSIPTEFCVSSDFGHCRWLVPKPAKSGGEMAQVFLFKLVFWLACWSVVGEECDDPSPWDWHIKLGCLGFRWKSKFFFPDIFVSPQFSGWSWCKRKDARRISYPKWDDDDGYYYYYDDDDDDDDDDDVGYDDDDEDEDERLNLTSHVIFVVYINIRRWRWLRCRCPFRSQTFPQVLGRPGEIRHLLAQEKYIYPLSRF